ncbi:MAG: hypothetical protein V7672_01120 [Brevundimonas sp.]|uniref:hypothetical protein n=1 Tax=Brevundimonas sp. TaxID=1871086 RepID=UPI0030021683
MTSRDRARAYIAQSEDATGLKNIRSHAQKANEQEIADLAFRRLIGLRVEWEPGTVEHDFWTTVHAFETVLSEERGRTTRLGRTRQKVARDGVVATLASWATGQPTEGFAMLRERNMLDLTGEAIVLRHPHHFDEAVIAACQQRLADAKAP